MANETFDPIKELQAVKEKRDMQRRKQYRKSKLEKYRSELVAMRKAGASSQDLATWLKMKHRLKIHRSSVDRYLSGLPEIAAMKAAITPTPQPVPAAKPEPPAFVPAKEYPTPAPLLTLSPSDRTT